MPSPEELALAEWSEATSTAAGSPQGKRASAYQFHQFVTPDTGRRPALRKFDFRLSTFNFSNRLTSNHLDPVAHVTICTTQRLYAMLRFFLIGMKHGYRGTSSREETGRPSGASTKR